MTAAHNTEFQAAPTTVRFLSNPINQLLILFGILFCGIWTGIVIQLQSTSEQLEQNTVRDGMNLSRAFAEQVRASVQGIDLSLLALREKWIQDPQHFQDAVVRQQNYFINEVGYQVSIINADGMLVYSNLGAQTKPVSLADREHFIVHRDRNVDRLFISKPVLGRVSKRWTVQFTRPILGEGNRFLGVIVISVPPDYFSHFYTALGPAKGNVVTLVRSSGDVLARSPNAEFGLGKTLADRPFLGLDAPGVGSFRDKGKLDDVERIFTWRQLKEFGLIVVIGHAVESVYVPYVRQRDSLLIFGILASALLAAFALAMITQTRQRTRATEALKVSEERNRLRVAALDAVGNAVVVTNIHAEIEWVNRAFETLTGYKRDEVFGRSLSSLVSSGVQTAEYYHEMWLTILAGDTWRGELMNRRKNGSVYHEEMVIAPVRSPSGVITHFVGVKQDISERKRNEKALQESHDLLAKLSAQVPGVIFQFQLHRDGSVSLPFVSQAVNDVYELTPEQLRDDPMAFSTRHHPHDAAAVAASITQSAKTLAPWHHEYRVVLPKRGERWLLSDARPERMEDGSILWHGAITDITDRKRAEEQLRIAAAAFELQEGMMVTDGHGTILRVNHAFEQLTGYSAEDVIGKTPAILRSGRQGEEFYTQMWNAITLKGYWEGEIWNRKKSGEIYPEWLVITAVKDAHGHVTHYVSAFSDITTRKDAEAQIRNLAFYDPLTSLPNRRLLTDRVTQVLAASARNGRHGALMLLDLDHFKTLNDTLGHDVGDQLLIQVAQRLNAAVREGDTVARLGGDEFVVMVQDLSADEATAAAQIETIATKLLTLLNQPYPLKGIETEYRNTPSIGICQFRGHDKPFDVLLKQSDIALYQAKDAGRNTYRFYSAEMQAALNRKAVMEAGLRDALANDGLLLHYQPQVDHMRRIVGVEALIRWQPPGKPMVSPAQFIPLAEETGLILSIGQWVLESACAQLAAWSRSPGTSALSVAVNVSAKQFRQHGFVDMVRSALDVSGANPARLKLELTESMILGDVEDAIGKMQALRDIGVTFALDDFGTGYSSLSYLRRLPLDQVKIDQSFVHDISSDQGNAAIVQTIIGMGYALNLQVLAEGVETSEQHAFLLENRCLHFQGFLFARPVPPERIAELIASVEPGNAEPIQEPVQ